MNKKTEIAIVAGGPAGLSAAVTAAEKGAKVILFEKSSTTGGAGNMGMGPLGVETRIQKNNLIEITRKEAFEIFMEYTHYQVDARIVKAYIDKSADTIEWLESLGVEFFGAYRYFSGSQPTWHIVKTPDGKIGPRAASSMFKILTDKAKELGVEIHLDTPVVEIKQNKKGEVTGVIAVNSNGEKIDCDAKAVLIATGGCGDNPEMIKEHIGLEIGKNFFPFRVPGVTGDGIKMAWKAGAQATPINVEMIFEMNYKASPWRGIDAVARQPNLFVNIKGKRFMNEEFAENVTFAGNAISKQPKRCMFSIFDEGLVKYYKRNGLEQISLVHGVNAMKPFDDQIASAEKDGLDTVFIANTWEELAKRAGIDVQNFLETIKEYNNMCKINEDDLFHKESRYMKEIGKGKLYAVKYYPGAYGSIGGVKINEYTEVLDKEDNPIPGLYCAGTDACSIYGDSYVFYLPGNTMGFAINSGRIAGESMVNHVRENS